MKDNPALAAQPIPQAGFERALVALVRLLAGYFQFEYLFGEAIAAAKTLKPLQIQGDVVFTVTEIATEAPPNSRILLFEDKILLWVIPFAQLSSESVNIPIKGMSMIEAKVEKAEPAGAEPVGNVMIILRGNQMFMSDLLELDESEVRQTEILRTAATGEISGGY